MNDFKAIKSFVDVNDLARAIYAACADMDARDYDETAEAEIQDIAEGLYHLKAIAENPYNNDYFRTTFCALARAFDQV